MDLTETKAHALDDFETFVDDYYLEFTQALLGFDRSPLIAILKILSRLAIDGGVLWVAGNGGSAAIANHTVCDLTKGTFREGSVLRCISLSANVPLLTAISNDISYEDGFCKQLEYYLKPGDAVLLVSSSGNSLNVVRACEYAKGRGNTTIAFVGFDGGKLGELADHCVWIPAKNYGVVEDTHQSLIHVLSQYIAHSRNM